MGGLYSEGLFNGGFFALPVWGLIFGGAYFRNFTVFSHRHCADKPCPYSGVDDVRVCDSGHRNVRYSYQPVSVL